MPDVIHNCLTLVALLFLCFHQRTPLDVALEKGHEDILANLKAHYAFGVSMRDSTIRVLWWMEKHYVTPTGISLLLFHMTMGVFKHILYSTGHQE